MRAIILKKSPVFKHEAENYSKYWTQDRVSIQDRLSLEVLQKLNYDHRDVNDNTESK